MIQSIQDAFNLIDQSGEDFPYDAIEYLYEHPADPAITEKIVFAITHVTDEDTYLDEDTGEFSMAPLCYMVVAERHVSEALIEPIIQFLSEEDTEGFEFECEQAAFLIGKLCEAMPEVAAPRFLDAIERIVKSETEAEYSYLYDALFFADAEKYGEQMLRIFKEPGAADPDILGQILAAKKIPGIMPLIEERLEMMKQGAEEFKDELDEEELEGLEFILEEMDALIEELKRGEVDFSAVSLPWVKMRPPWKEYLQGIEDDLFNFLEDEDDDEDFFLDDDDYLDAPDELNDPFKDDYVDYEEVQETVKREHPKVGRNEPCPCGSGKKFKNCHWGKGIYD